jgi:hypothetical protein
MHDGMFTQYTTCSTFVGPYAIRDQVHTRLWTFWNKVMINKHVTAHSSSQLSGVRGSVQCSIFREWQLEFTIIMFIAIYSLKRFCKTSCTHLLFWCGWPDPAVLPPRLPHKALVGACKRIKFVRHTHTCLIWLLLLWVREYQGTGLNSTYLEIVRLNYVTAARWTFTRFFLKLQPYNISRASWMQL